MGARVVFMTTGVRVGGRSGTVVVVAALGCEHRDTRLRRLVSFGAGLNAQPGAGIFVGKEKAGQIILSTVIVPGARKRHLSAQPAIIPWRYHSAGDGSRKTEKLFRFGHKRGCARDLTLSTKMGRKSRRPCAHRLSVA
jgi:hypothetical protein